MLRIGQFSKLARLNIKTLRYYDKIGLLKPAMIDTDSSYRYYTEDQLQRVNRITTYKEAGLSNESIMQLLEQEADAHGLLQKQKCILLEQEQKIQSAISRIDDLLIGTSKQTYSATVKHVDRHLVYCCRGYVSNTECIHDFIQACVKEFTKTNPDIELTEEDYCCVLYPDDGYRESNIFIEYAQSVKSFGRDTAVLKFKEIEPITAVSVLHYGRYDTMRDAYLFAINWIQENGYTLNGEPRERYINGAWNRKDISQWLTELQLPIKEQTR